MTGLRAALRLILMLRLTGWGCMGWLRNVCNGVPFVTAPSPLLDPLCLAALHTGIPFVGSKDVVMWRAFGTGRPLSDLLRFCSHPDDGDVPPKTCPAQGCLGCRAWMQPASWAASPCWTLRCRQGTVLAKQRDKNGARGCLCLHASLTSTCCGMLVGGHAILLPAGLGWAGDGAQDGSNWQLLCDSDLDATLPPAACRMHCVQFGSPPGNNTKPIVPWSAHQARVPTGVAAQLHTVGSCHPVQVRTEHPPGITQWSCPWTCESHGAVRQWGRADYRA
eukprot:361808-Chlamydomonas_euryale.AAC.21